MHSTRDYSDYEVLMKSLKERDILGFDYLYTSLRTKLFALALYIIGDEENARDLIQDLFIDFWENRLYEQVTSTFENYLIRAAKNRAINFKKRRIPRIYLNESFGKIELQDGYLSIENQELGEKLSHAIEQLSPMSTKVFQLHYIDQLSYDEISKQLGISKSTISTHMDRALKKLRSKLKKDE